MKVQRVDLYKMLKTGALHQQRNTLSTPDRRASNSINASDQALDITRDELRTTRDEN